MCWRKQSCLLLVEKVKSLRVGAPPPFLVPKGGLVRMSVAPCLRALRLLPKRVAVADTGSVGVGLEPVQHQVHQRQPVGVLHVLHAVERIAPIHALLRLGPGVGVAVLADVAVGGDEKAPGAGSGVLDDVVEPRPHHRHHAVDQRPGREVLAGAGLLLVGVLLQQPFVEIAESFLPRAVPVELVDLAHQRGERGWFLDEGAGVGENLLHQARALAAEVDQRLLVGLQPVEAGVGFQIVPAVAGGELVFGAGLLGHLEKEQISQLGDVLVIGDSVVLQDVAEVPELGDDVGGDGAHTCG